MISPRVERLGVGVCLTLVIVCDFANAALLLLGEDGAKGMEGADESILYLWSLE